MKEKVSTKSTAPTRRRRHRSRPTPKWLLEQKETDAVAQRRCLMLLSVLSGEKAVTDAIAEAQISRQLYYQLETKALHAMLRALTPGADEEGQSMGPALSRVAELERKATRLEQEKRRLERLLFLTRKLVKSGTLTMGPGRPRRPTRLLGSGGAGSRGLEDFKSTKEPTSVSSIPTKDGEAES